MSEGYWWCPHCEEEVGWNRATNGEKHDTCGHPLTWIEPDATNWQERYAELVAFQPTPAQINALPEGVRRYVCALETRADPAGEVADRTLALDQNAQLVAALATKDVLMKRLASALRTCVEADGFAAQASAMCRGKDRLDEYEKAQT